MNISTVEKVKSFQMTASTSQVFRVIRDVLMEFELTKGRADLLLRRHLQKHHRTLGGPERAKISKTIFNVIRWRSRLDYLISRLLKRDAGSLEPSSRILYRLAVFNIVFLQRTVDLTCNISDSLCTGSDDLKRSLRTFIKTLHVNHQNIPFPNSGKNRVHAWSIIHAHPSWLIERWISIYGEADTERLLMFDNNEPQLHIRVNALKATAAEVVSALHGEGLECRPLPGASYGFVVSGPVAAMSTTAFREGAFEVQDVSSQLFVEWCRPASGCQVLDACAGGGGKSLFMAALMNNTGRIIAHDRNPSALAELKKRAARAGAFNIEIRTTVAAMPGKSFDIVLVDAPCSGLGTLQRNPDIKWNLEPSDVANLESEQLRILSDYAAFVKPGGRLVYATCTLLPEENENVVQKFLSSFTEFNVIRTKAPFVDDDGFFRLVPHQHGMSGFFACSFQRI